MQIKVYMLREKHFIFYNIKMLLYGIKEIYSIIVAQDWDENWALEISVILNKFPYEYFFEQISFERNDLHTKKPPVIYVLPPLFSTHT